MHAVQVAKSTTSAACEAQVSELDTSAPASTLIPGRSTGAALLREDRGDRTCYRAEGPRGAVAKAPTMTGSRTRAKVLRSSV